MNTELLENMRCPKCGHEGPFWIYAHAWFEVFDDGTGEFQDVTWEEDTDCGCPACDLHGDVLDFLTSPTQETPA